MKEKPKLTLEEALVEFPKECRAITSPNWVYNAEWLLGAQTPEQYKNHLLITALCWLAGKELMRLGSTTSYRNFMPVDLLRWVLEEVAEHLKLEAKK